MRRSPAIVIANALAELGATVHAYDPATEAANEARPSLDPRIEIFADRGAATKDAEAVFVATDWPEFTDNAATWLADCHALRVLVDCMNSLRDADLPPNITYIGVGRKI